ncbi:polysaccharide pyruvyl transferase family protein [Bosea sp. TAF32]|uniref:polysaccharide pyruvyl transferase family protein n=1 Tax=Bosea sp. TAF32 TaxID=3237482 RepID=UPI003F93059F
MEGKAMRRNGPGTIAFFGHFNSTNFGNECSLQAALYNLRRLYPGSKFICITDDHENAAKADDVEAVPVNQELFKFWVAKTSLGRLVRRAVLGFPAELWRCISAIMVLRRAQMLIVPGTGLLTDVFGLGGCGPYGLFRWALIAKLCGCRLLFLSVGVGPLYRRLGRFFAKSALSLADFRSYREISSREYLASIGFKAGCDPVYPDLAFSLPIPALPSEGNKAHEIGLGVMSYAGNYSVPNPSASTDQDYWDKLVRFSRWLISQGYNVRPLIGDTVDVSARDRFIQLLGEGAQAQDDDAIIDEPVTSVESLLSALTVSDFVVATRFHNVLLALLGGKPVIAISFHHKCASLMAAMGMSAYCLDIHALDSDALIQTFELLTADASDVKAQIAQKVLEFRDELDDQYRRAFGVAADATGLRAG